ncbi:bifunctional riboflavin kinase/FAD synthetase [Wenzhouxiangella marina]|uniref:Riboflavin biosynthesis protein n=1 Tax=Wenzhouxiangella marina TaxID=1579979 RepID=A0A0K0XYH2_9GAMM|nr:bifunctional riboflavin kinase/FAD synthetase [Wenzhouxiangella marina]AKS42681.1 putative riboflavin biosynthesis protein [Wenzhouxiangella marina]MBB6088630.1 riboflavin kinase/FMN adenylyltransferase [Wenzhouxiangella marina]
MRLIRDTSPARAPSAATALAIGNFDGLHRGHQALIRRVCARSDELVPSLMCFEPLPISLFRPEDPISRIYSVRDRLVLCRGFGLDRVYMMRFDRAFAALSAEAFVERIVVDLARARHVVVGDDFRFGARAAGDVELLETLGARLGFEVSVIGAVELEAERVSSTALRQALDRGEMSRVRALLGRSYSLSGRVLRGRQLGRTLGYPTVNLRPPLPPAARGIFAVRVSGAGLDRHPGVASLGQRPTVDGKGWLLEAHLFDYDGDLYGRHLSIELVEYLRPEEKFESLPAMCAQMDDDAARARALLQP